jgi:DNA-binding response OmpR family regulator
MSRILVVDDDATIAFALRILLQRRGHEVAVAASVPAARTQLATSPPDAALVDRRIDGDGLLFAAELEQGVLQGRVWLVTGDPPQGELPGFPASRVVRKPFDFDALVAELEAAVSRRS